MAQTRTPAKLRDQAYASFTQHLRDRELEPGQFISQRELVVLTGHPLGAIRELIPRLEAEGLIRTVPQRGMQIATVDLTLVRDAFQFRLILEREAALHYARTAADSDIEDWRIKHQAILDAVNLGPVDEQLIDAAQALDDGFHDALIDALGNAIISHAYRVNSIKIRLIRHAKTRLHTLLVEPVMREHLELIAALSSRNEDEVARTFTHHINNARNRALTLDQSPTA
jgi:DNA-binding GntR family transcriptional regulator